MGSVQSREHTFQTLSGYDGPFVGSNLGTNIFVDLNSAAERIPHWSIYPGYRDFLLRKFFKTESIYAGAVYSMVAKMKSLPRIIEGPDRAKKAAEDVFKHADFDNGHMTLIGKTVQDILTQDNGYFWELVGPGSADGPLLGAPTQVNYLDPGSCYRTFDLTYPVLYIDPINGSRHRIHRTRVISGSSQPQPEELARGVGFCSLSRVLARVRLVKAITQHRLEVTTGTQKKAIIHGKGVSARTLRRALRRSDVEQEQEEMIEHQGIPILTTAQGVELNVLSLAGMPDGYNMVDEHTIYVYIVALGLGVDAREIWPATVTGASKADASVQHMKARGKGFADILTELERAHDLVLKLFSPSLHIVHDFVDDEQDAMTADLYKKQVEVFDKYMGHGAINSKELRALGIVSGALDPTVLDNLDSLDGMDGFEDPEDLEDPEEVVETEVVVEDATEEEDELELVAAAVLGIKTETSYEAALRAAARGLYNGSLDMVQFIDAMDSAIRRGLTQAAFESFRSAGFDPSDMTFEEQQKLFDFIAVNMSHVLPLAKYILLAKDAVEVVTTITQVFKRIKMWVRQYNKVRNFFKTLIGADLKYRWVWDPVKEHCKDCERLNGRVYRASTWARYDVRPQSSRLKCKGLNCGCELNLTNAHATPGFPPRIG